jgi:inner membrane protein
MPSPVGHALGGLIAGWLSSGRSAAPVPGSHDPRRTYRRAALFASLGVAPDLDLLFGTHSTYTHSVGAVALAWLMASAATRGGSPRFAVACAAAWASHLLLDWLGADSTPPLGIMALWPFSREFYLSPVAVFSAISRRYWLPDFYRFNTIAVLRELLILGPVLWLTTRTRGTRGLSSDRGARRRPSAAAGDTRGTSDPPGRRGARRESRRTRPGR